MTEGPARVHLRISGLVQGVFYRASCRNEAMALGLHGWVRNLPDGCVEALAEGPREQVEHLVAWCRRGPRHASVRDVAVHWSPATGEFDTFHVTG